jgi:hypothetical protein
MSEIELRDAIIRHALQLQRLAAGQSGEADAILKELERELRALLNSNVLSEAGKAQINALIGEAVDAIHPAYAKIAASLDTHSLALIVAEKTVEAMNEVLPVDVVAPSPERLASLTKDVMIDGAPSSAWWDKQAEDTAFKFAAAGQAGSGQWRDKRTHRRSGSSGAGEPGIWTLPKRMLAPSSTAPLCQQPTTLDLRRSGRMPASSRG